MTGSELNNICETGWGPIINLMESLREISEKRKIPLQAMGDRALGLACYYAGKIEEDADRWISARNEATRENFVFVTLRPKEILEKCTPYTPIDPDGFALDNSKKYVSIDRDLLLSCLGIYAYTHKYRQKGFNFIVQGKNISLVEILDVEPFFQGL